jgi:hypothetical protein
MISLRGARVLLIDDISDEALPIIKAFAKKGIPVAYFNGSIGDLPEESEKFTGVRLAILDMDLVGGGDTNDNKISTLISRLQAILSTDNGPYTMIAWTKHIELVELLESKLFALYQAKEILGKVPLPVVCLRLEKKDYKTGTDFDVAKLASSIESKLKDSIPLRTMQTWEEECLRAAIGVTNNLSNMVARQDNSLVAWRESWNKECLGLLISLAREEIGGDNLSKETFLNALFGALNPLHADFFETDHVPLPELLDDMIPKPVNGENNPLAGKINTRLHLSFKNIEQFRPGNIYKLSDYAGLFPVNSRGIFDNLIQVGLKDKDDVFNKVTPILLEVSASCDYAQNKIKLARYLAGIIIPIEEINKFKKPDGYLLKLPLFWIDNKDCCVFLSSQHIVSLDLQQAKEQMHAFARLRSQGLIYVQFWMAQQMSRPGVMMLK